MATLQAWVLRTQAFAFCCTEHFTVTLGNPPQTQITELRDAFFPPVVFCPLRTLIDPGGVWQSWPPQALFTELLLQDTSISSKRLRFKGKNMLLEFFRPAVSHNVLI